MAIRDLIPWSRQENRLPVSSTLSTTEATIRYCRFTAR
jgi:hypothetical protein